MPRKTLLGNHLFIKVMNRSKGPQHSEYGQAGSLYTLVYCGILWYTVVYCDSITLIIQQHHPQGRSPYSCTLAMATSHIDKARLKKLLEVKSSIRKALSLSPALLPKVVHSEVGYYKDLIIFGNRFSKTLNAPPGYQPGGALVAGHPPAPQPDNMRKGRLGNIKLEILKDNNIVDEHWETPEVVLPFTDIEKPEVVKSSIAKSVTTMSQSNPRELTHPPTMIIASKKREIEEEISVAEPRKRQRQITIDFGFDSDSEDSDS